MSKLLFLLTLAVVLSFTLPIIGSILHAVFQALNQFGAMLSSFS